MSSRVPQSHAVPNLDEQRLLILDHYGFGNVVMSLPLLRTLCGGDRPAGPVKVLFRSPDHFELVRGEGLQVEPLYLRGRYGGMTGLLRLCWDLRGHIDGIVAVPQIPASRVVVLRLAIGARWTAGETLANYRRLFTYPVEKGWTRSVLDTQQDIATALGFHQRLPPPTIRLTDTEKEWSQRVLDSEGLADATPVVGVHCSALNLSKKWPAENFSRVLRQVTQHVPNAAVISFGSEGERADAETVRRQAEPIKWLEGTGAWTIRETLAMLQRCELVVSGDTAIMHMAAAVGAQTVSIFGPTSSARLAPTHNRGVAIRPDTPCHPCYRDRDVACTCIRTIVPEDVTSAVIRCLHCVAPGEAAGS